MAKMTLAELRALRDAGKKDLNTRETVGKNIDIIVGMGTCGIAAGAKEAVAAFVEELKAQGITNASVKQTGCMGLCYVEPTIEIKMKEMPNTIYGNVSADVAKKIVLEHIVNKTLVSDHIHDKPAGDIMK